MDDLDRAVRSALEAGRIGRPVYVRCILCTDGDRVALATAWLTQIEVWLGSPIASVYARGDTALAVMIQCLGGQSAQIIVNPAHGTPRTDLMLLGDRGAFTFEADEMFPSTPPAPELTEAVCVSRDAGTPVRVDAGAFA